jgi:hypothetical protein
MSGSDLCIPRNETACMASLLPKQNNIVLSPNFHIHVFVSDIPMIGLEDPSLEYINRSQIHECRNWERGRAVSFLGIDVSNFRYSAT